MLLDGEMSAAPNSFTSFGFTLLTVSSLMRNRMQGKDEDVSHTFTMEFFIAGPEM